MKLSWTDSLKCLWYLALFVLWGGRLKSWPVAPDRPGGPRRMLFEMDPDCVEFRERRWRTQKS